MESIDKVRDENRDASGTRVPELSRQKTPIDIEALLQWAVARSGRLPWVRDDYRSLTLNPYSAQPRRRPVTSWTLAIACAGQRLFVGAGTPATMIPGADAERVLQAIAGLGDPALCETVRVCARARIRPDWMEGIEPRRVAKRIRCRRQHRLVTKWVWEPHSPEQIRAARDAYARWHRALLTLSEKLRDDLNDWHINGLAAPAAPWDQRL